MDTKILTAGDWNVTLTEEDKNTEINNENSSRRFDITTSLHGPTRHRCVALLPAVLKTVFLFIAEYGCAV
jgi:hypothetical protein